MKNILFINMPIRESAPPNNIPLGPLVLASHLNRNRYNTQILDLNLYRKKSKDYDYLYDIIKTRLDSENYWYAICLSGLVTTLWYQETVAKIIKKTIPNTRIICGGGLATDIKGELYEWIPELDAINIGPGEINIIPILKELYSRDKPRMIYYGSNPHNLDDYFDLDFSLVEIDKYIHNPIWGVDAKNSSNAPFIMKRSLNSITSKGCIFNCNFCDLETAGGRDYRMRSPENLIAEMVRLIELYNIDFLGYIDDNATLDKKRLEKWSILIKEHELNLNWGTHARLDDIGNNKDKARILSEMNCIYLGFGGESADKNILREMNKGKSISESDDYVYNGYIFPEIYIKALEYCKKYGIHPNLTWIMGYPTETLEELKTTIAFILFMEDEGYVERRYNNHSLFVATAYPNTDLFNHPIVQEKIKKGFPSFKNYIYNLEDATKTIISDNEEIMNYSNINDDVFLKIRDYVKKDELEKILDL